MIFITLGTQKFQLNRLLEQMDRLIEADAIKEEVFAQIGHSDYHPKNYSYQDFLTPGEMEERIAACDLLITHSGVATIVSGKQHKKPIIVFPRLARYKEHVDDHQMQIAKAFGELDFVLVCKEEKELLGKIEEARVHVFKDYQSNKDQAIAYIRRYLSDKHRRKVLMVGVDQKRIGGMWTVAETYIKNPVFRSHVDLTYIPTNTYGSLLSRILFMGKAYLKVFGVLCKHHFDLVHVHMAEKGSTFRKGVIVSLAGLFHKKIVIQLHAGPFMAWYETLSKARQTRVRKIFARAHRVLVLGEYWMKEMEQIVDPKKLEVLYNGVPCPKENPYNPDGNLILYLGVMKKAKGTFDLIKAMESIENQLDKHVKLYLCGSPEEDGIEEAIKKARLEDRIKLLGWISKEERLELFRDTRLVVHPSYFEALSMTILEAISYGIPVVATDISTSPELLGSDTALVPVGDWKKLGQQILAWSGDRKYRMQLSHRLYQHAVDTFSVERNIAHTLRIYEDVISEE